MNDSPFDFEEALAPFLQEKTSVSIAVAVSGGPDSMALCSALAQYSKGAVHVLTVDHGLRPEALEEAETVGKWVSHWPQVQHVILTRRLSSKPVTKIQEEARHDRYKLMADYCAENDIRSLFVAHHQNDQAETFLFRLAKGSGLDGLGAMRPVYDYSETLQIIRPFLNAPKSALVNFCAARDISYFEDPSNDDKRFARVRLRGAYDVLAEEGLTPKRLSVTASRLARAREALDFYAGSVLENTAFENNSDRVVFDFEKLNQAPEEIRLRVLVKAMKMLQEKKGYGPRMEKLESLVCRLFEDNTFKRASLGGCLIGLNHKTGTLTVEREK